MHCRIRERCWAVSVLTQTQRQEDVRASGGEAPRVLHFEDRRRRMSPPRACELATDVLTSAWQLIMRAVADIAVSSEQVQ